MLVTLALLAASACAGTNTGASDDASDDGGMLGFHCNMPSMGQSSVETSAPASVLQTDEGSCLDAGGTVSTSMSCPTASLAGCRNGIGVALPDPNGSGGFIENRQTCYYTGVSDAGGAKAECDDWSTTPLTP